VNFSRVLRWSVAVLIPLTLAWKIAIPPFNPDVLKGELVEFFERNGFNVVVTDQLVDYVPIIKATTDSCRLLVARLTPDGSNRDLIRSLTNDPDRQFVVFRGDVYTHLPVFWTVTYYLYSRFLRELGLIRDIAPVIAVGANSSCNTDRLPWRELAP
jgi:hypothetical protein